MSDDPYRARLFCRHCKSAVLVSKLAEKFSYWLCMRCRKINRGC